MIPECIEFLHLYRCGHIEGSPSRIPKRGGHRHFCIFIDAATLKAERPPHPEAAASYFCIFIDAATLKGEARNNLDAVVRDFCIFIDAATLKESVPVIRLGDLRPDFCIFIDAATLKAHKHGFVHVRRVGFLHLYRCGHIEGLTTTAGETPPKGENFCIFIDAATLKGTFSSHKTSPPLFISASL